MLWRLILGPIMIGLVIGLFWLDLKWGNQAPVLALFASAIVIRGAWEYARLLSVRAFQVSYPIVAVLSLLVVLANWIPTAPVADGQAPSLGWPLLAFGIAGMVLFARAMWRFRAPGATLETLGAEVLGVTYFALFLTTIVQLRWIHGGELLYVPLASVVVITKCGDISAYFTGRAFGGPKMSPFISPGKTMAGGIGAIVGGTLGGLAWLHWGTTGMTLFQPGKTWAILIYGVTIAFAGLLGDLAESMIKRDVGQKDAPALLPSFGGLLDIVDSVVYCGPVALLLWVVLPLVAKG